MPDNVKTQWKAYFHNDLVFPLSWERNLDLWNHIKVPGFRKYDSFDSARIRHLVWYIRMIPCCTIDEVKWDRLLHFETWESWSLYVQKPNRKCYMANIYAIHYTHRDPNSGGQWDDLNKQHSQPLSALSLIEPVQLRMVPSSLHRWEDKELKRNRGDWGWIGMRKYCGYIA